MLCDEDLELISSWTFDVTEEQEADLTPSGALEQELVGRRQAQRFPDLLGQAYSEELFRVSGRCLQHGLISSGTNIG